MPLTGSNTPATNKPTRWCTRFSSSSCAFPAISLEFTIFFFFCVPSYIFGVCHSSSSAFPARSLGFTIRLLFLRSQLYLRGSPSSSSSSSCAFPAISQGFTIFFFLCVPSYISGLHHSSSCAFPATSQSSPFFFFLCVPSYISGVHHSSSSCEFPVISLGFTILLLLLLVRSQLYL